jgi:hypothetical protein
LPCFRKGKERRQKESKENKWRKNEKERQIYGFRAVNYKPQKARYHGKERQRRGKILTFYITNNGLNKYISVSLTHGIYARMNMLHFSRAFH